MLFKLEWKKITVKRNNVKWVFNSSKTLGIDELLQFLQALHTLTLQEFSRILKNFKEFFIFMRRILERYTASLGASPTVSFELKLNSVQRENSTQRKQYRGCMQAT